MQSQTECSDHNDGRFYLIRHPRGANVRLRIVVRSSRALPVHIGF